MENLTLAKQIHEVLELDEGRKEGNPFIVKHSDVDGINNVVVTLFKGTEKLVTVLRNTKGEMDDQVTISEGITGDGMLAVTEFLKQF